MNQGWQEYSILPMRTGLTKQLNKWSILDELDELEKEWAMHEYISHKYVKPLNSSFRRVKFYGNFIWLNSSK